MDLGEKKKFTGEKKERFQRSPAWGEGGDRGLNQTRGRREWGVILKTGIKRERKREA